jgi:protein SCO1/2
LAVFSGCTKSAPAPAEAPISRYPLHGVIVSVDTPRQTLLVQHAAVPGYMPAMTMEFAVSPGDLANARPGQRIRAELVANASGDLRLEKIWPDDQVAGDTVAAGTRALREDTSNRGKGAYREVGETMPDFALYNQSGAAVTAARFRGRQIMLNFIYTRCPVAAMCPLATAKMTQTQQLARAAGVPDIEFVSFTLDPEHDTPGVLQEYARQRGIDLGNFSFLTGPESAIGDLLTQFGVIAEFKGGLLKHTLATLLIDRHGRIVHRADGSTWEPADFVAKMQR